MELEALPTDEVLLTGLQENDEKAFERIYARYSPDLLDFAARRLESLTEAKDILQDVFIDLWAKRATLHIRLSLRSYLFSTVRYKMIDHIRKNIKRDYYAKMVKTIHNNMDNSTFDHILYNDLNTFAESEIDKLPRRVKEVFLLSRHQHLSIREIAHELQVSEQTVKNQLTTAMRKLRPALSKIITVFVPFL